MLAKKVKKTALSDQPKAEVSARSGGMAAYVDRGSINTMYKNGVHTHYYGTFPFPQPIASDSINPFTGQNVGQDFPRNNPYRYNSGSTVKPDGYPIGRRAELDYLISFCEDTPDYSEQYGDFVWFAVSGEGGTGKTRLAHDLIKKVKAKGWNCAVVTKEYERSIEGAIETIILEAKQDSVNKPRYLIVLDYIKGYTDSLKDWISKFQQVSYAAKMPIRLLLVERYAFRNLPSEYQYDPPKRPSFIDPNGLMYLGQLSDADLRELVTIFAAWLSKEKKLKIENLNIDAVMHALQEIDRGTARPLFAMFLTGASMEKNDVRQWKRKEALEYACCREYGEIYFGQYGRLYSACITQYGAGDGRKLYENLTYLLLLATLALGVDLEKDLDKLDETTRKMIEEIKATAEKNPNYSRAAANPPFARLVKELLESQDGKRLTQIEPDLLGEYYCVKRLREMADEDDRDMWMRRARNYDGRNAAIVAGRVIGDYGRSDYNLLGDMARLFRDVTLEKNVEPGQYAGTIIENVECEEGVTAIKERGFFEATRLRTVTFSEGLTDIGRRAFYGCTALREIIIPASVTKIGAWAFHGCAALESVTVQSSATEIDVGAFSDCIALSKVSIPNGARIHARAFENTSIVPGTLPEVEGIPESYILQNQPLRTIPGADGIRWRTLDVDHNHALLISEQCVEELPYDDVTGDDWIGGAYRGTTWAECALRKYLNSREYHAEQKPWFKDGVTADREKGAEEKGDLNRLSAMFRRREAKTSAQVPTARQTGYTTKTKGFLSCLPPDIKIETRDLVTPSNPVYGTDGGAIAQNQSVFLLSLDEADRYFKDDEDRIAYQKGGPHSGTGSWWWLRSPGHDTGDAACVYIGGALSPEGDFVYSEAVGVRPALWLNL